MILEDPELTVAELKGYARRHPKECAQMVGVFQRKKGEVMQRRMREESRREGTKRGL